MATDCIDVCSMVINTATRLGLDVGEDDDHVPVFEALEKMLNYLEANRDGFREALDLD